MRIEREKCEDKCKYCVPVCVCVFMMLLPMLFIFFFKQGLSLARSSQTGWPARTRNRVMNINHPFYLVCIGCGNLISGPHACMTSTLLTGFLPSPEIINKFEKGKWAGERTQQRKSPAAFTEVAVPIPRAHIGVHNSPGLQFEESKPPSLASTGMRHFVHRHTCRQNTYTQKSFFN